jgi:tetratricopeptide (TPR) repeat protein
MIFLLSLLLAACTLQPISGAQMAEANRLYEAGEFTAAVAAYQSLVEAGAEDGLVYYNLANAYFKAGDLGRAILNYHRAQRLLPRDGDVAANLQLARAQLIDRLASEEEGALVGLARRLLVTSTTLDEAATLALGVWLLLCALAIAALLWPRSRRGLVYAAAVVAALLALSLLSLGLHVAEERSPVAIVVAKEVAVYSGPGTDYLNEFTLHAGAQVHWLESRQGWVRVALPGDLQGWLPAEAVEEVGKRPSARSG